MSDKNKALVSIIVANILFGFAFIFSKQALIACNNDVFTMIAHRFLVAAIGLFILKKCRVFKTNYKGKDIKEILVIATIYPVGYFIFETLGLKYSTSSHAGLMIAMVPVIVTIIGIFVLKEIPSLLQGICIILSIAGVLILNTNSSNQESSMLGLIFLGCAIFSAAIYNILMRKYSSKYTSFELTYAMVLEGAIVFNIVAITKGTINNNVYTHFEVLQNPKFLISILYLGIFTSIIAFFLMNYSLSHIEASKVSSFSSIGTLVTVVVGVIVFGDKIGIKEIIGMFLILFGVWGVNKFEKQLNTNTEID